MSKKPHLLRCRVGSKDKDSPTTSNNAAGVEAVGAIGEEEAVDIAGAAAVVEATMEGEGDTIKEVWPAFFWSFLVGTRLKSALRARPRCAQMGTGIPGIFY